MRTATPISLRDRLPLPLRFLCAACRYWLRVFPQVRVEIGGWRDRARQIPDPLLRDLALRMQTAKVGNLEGAAAYAAFARKAHRLRVVAAQVAFQTAYDYADVLSERGSGDPVANGHALHSALLPVVESAARREDYYAHCGSPDDAGYLTALSDTCRIVYDVLPARGAFVAPLQRAIGRIVAYQGRNHRHPQGTHLALADWASSETPEGTDLRWWETAASAGSSTGIFSFIAAASDPDMDHGRSQELESAYFPWAGSLHTLLDSLVDRHEDARAGQRSLLDYYGCEEEAIERMRHIAGEAARRLLGLPDGQAQLIVFAAMASLYVISVRSESRCDHAISGAVLDAIGRPVLPALIVFALRRSVARTRARLGRSHSIESCICLGEGSSGASVSRGLPRLAQWPITCWLRALW